MNGVAEQFGVSSDQLTSALDMMVKRGTAPSIDSLANLSQQFLSIKDPVERAQLMSDKLGKNWTSLNEILEKGPDAIKGAADALNGSLIVTEAQAEKAEQLAIAWNKVNQEVEAFKISVFGNAIPALATLMTGTQDINTLLAQHADQVALGSVSYNDYAEELKRAAEAAGYVVDADGNLVAKYNVLAGVTHQYIKENYLLTQGQYDTVRAAQKSKTAYDEATVGISHWMHATQEATPSEFALSDATAEAARQQSNLAEITGFTSAKMADQKTHADNLNSTLDGAAKAQDALAKAEEAWKAGVGGDIATQLQNAGLAPEKLKGAEEAVDQKFGTDIVAQQNRAKAIKDAITEYGKTGDLDAFRTHLGYIQDGFMPLDQKIADAQKAVKDFSDELDNLNGKHVDVFVGVHTIDVGDTSAQPGNVSGTPGHPGRINPGQEGYASGTDSATPGPHVVGEDGPEVVNFRGGESVTPTSALGGITIQNMTVVSNDPQDFMNKLGQLARNARKSGKGYAGIG
jgi:hypothetical protein